MSCYLFFFPHTVAEIKYSACLQGSKLVKMLQIREVIILTFVTLIVGKEPVFKLKPRTTGI